MSPDTASPEDVDRIQSTYARAFLRLHLLSDAGREETLSREWSAANESLVELRRPR
jgi:hypothetical protein